MASSTAPEVTDRLPAPVLPRPRSQKAPAAWVLRFLLFQIACQVALLVETFSYYRMPIRLMSFGASLFLIVWLTGRGRLHPAGKLAPVILAVILQVSRMERLKGQVVLLEALSRLRDLPGWICWIVGGAQRTEEINYQNELKALAARAGLADRVDFLGERTDVRQLLAAADLYCQPNLSADAFGITFVEALYAGLPVVTSAVGGALEIVNTDCGVLLPPGDPAALALAIRGLVTDPVARARLGGRGPCRARQLCDPEVALRGLQDLLTRPASKQPAC